MRGDRTPYFASIVCLWQFSCFKLFVEKSLALIWPKAYNGIIIGSLVFVV
jgi:hypothetical protein